MIIKATQDAIEQAARLIAGGGIVAFPTETVYGIGANALDPIAVAKIFEVKQRPLFDPLIVHVDSMDMARSVAIFDKRAERLAEAFWPGPMTLVLPKTSAVPAIVTAGFPTVAVRMPDHPVALELVRRAEIPVAAPSANAFGKLSPTSAGHVEEQLGDAVSLILDGGPSRVGVESTIIDTTRAVPTVVRAGGLSREAIERCIGPVCIDISASERPDAPGKLKHHYAPRTARLVLLDCAWTKNARPFAPGKRYGLLAFRPSHDLDGFAYTETLSENGSLEQAASRLFGALHVLDAQRLDVIFAEPVPENGLGLAIMDRLRRGAADQDEML